MGTDLEKHAVVLSGGGGFGAFEVGVMRALVSGKSPATGGEPLKAEIFTGTSVGAYNAAVLASKGQLDERAAVAHLEDLWLNRIAGDLAANGVLRIRGNPLSLFNSGTFRSPMQQLMQVSSDAMFLGQEAVRRLSYFMRSKESFGRRAMEMFDVGQLICMEPLEKLVRDTVSLEELQNSNKILKIAATNWATGGLRIFVHDPARRGQEWKEAEEEEITRSTWPEAVLASTAIPGIFPAVRIEGWHYVDGGVVMNTPLRPAIDAGASVIHLIAVTMEGNDIPLNNAPPNTAEIVARLLHLVVAATVDDDISTAKFINNMLHTMPQNNAERKFREITIHRYHPRIDLGGVVAMLDFRRERLKMRMDAGELTAIQHDCEQEGCVIPR